MNNKAHYAVIFISKRNEGDTNYTSTAREMEELCRIQPGFIGMDYGVGEKSITICYWENLESIQNWKENIAHKAAQEKGRNIWYQSYELKVCKIEKQYAWKRDSG